MTLRKFVVFSALAPPCAVGRSPQRNRSQFSMKRFRSRRHPPVKWAHFVISRRCDSSRYPLVKKFVERVPAARALATPRRVSRAECTESRETTDRAGRRKARTSAIQALNRPFNPFLCPRRAARARLYLSRYACSRSRPGPPSDTTLLPPFTGVTPFLTDIPSGRVRNYQVCIL